MALSFKTLKIRSNLVLDQIKYTQDKGFVNIEFNRMVSHLS